MTDGVEFRFVTVPFFSVYRVPTEASNMGNAGKCFSRVNLLKKMTILQNILFIEKSGQVLDYQCSCFLQDKFNILVVS